MEWLFNNLDGVHNLQLKPRATPSVLIMSKISACGSDAYFLIMRISTLTRLYLNLIPSVVKWQKMIIPWNDWMRRRHDRIILEMSRSRPSCTRYAKVVTWRNWSHSLRTKKLLTWSTKRTQQDILPSTMQLVLVSDDEPTIRLCGIACVSNRHSFNYIKMYNVKL